MTDIVLGKFARGLTVRIDKSIQFSAGLLNSGGWAENPTLVFYSSNKADAPVVLTSTLAGNVAQFVEDDVEQFFSGQRVELRVGDVVLARGKVVVND